MCRVFAVPLGVCLRATGILRWIVGGRRDGWNKLLKVHHVGQEGILGSSAFWVDRTRTMGGELGRNNKRTIEIIHTVHVKGYNVCVRYDFFFNILTITMK